MFRHWYEKLTFSMAIVSFFLFVAINVWIMLIFEILFLVLWVSGGEIPKPDEGRP